MYRNPVEQHYVMTLFGKMKQSSDLGSRTQYGSRIKIKFQLSRSEKDK